MVTLPYLARGTRFQQDFYPQTGQKISQFA
jgi:hypothetical protein